MTVKAIIFDCFGVLAQGSLTGFYDRHFGDDETARREAYDLEQASSRGMITHEQWLAELADLAQIQVAQAESELTNNPPNENLFNYIAAKLKPDFKIGFLSNAADDFREELFTPEQLKLFDDFVISYRVRLAKPDVRIYELAAERLGLLPGECVFVDDIERYCAAAEDAGMQSIWYRSFKQFEHGMHKLLH